MKDPVLNALLLGNLNFHRFFGLTLVQGLFLVASNQRPNLLQLWPLPRPRRRLYPKEREQVLPQNLSLHYKLDLVVSGYSI